MKKSTLLAALLLVFSTKLLAQDKHPFPSNPKWSKPTKDFRGRQQAKLQRDGSAYKTDAVVSQMDSTYTWKWGSTTKVMYQVGNFSYTYDANSNRTEKHQREFNNTVWENGYLYGYSFDASKNITKELYQAWNPTAKVWMNLSKHDYIFDANNMNTSDTYQEWNDVTLKWEAQDKYTNTYDASKNQTSSLYQTWDKTGGVWVNDYSIVYVYNANNKLTIETAQTWKKASSSWVNEYKVLYAYDGNKNNTQHLGFYWNTATTKWDSAFKATFTYDAKNNRTSELDQEWIDSKMMFEDYYKYAYTYDASNNMTSEISHEWTGTNWMNDLRKSYWYNLDNNLLSQLVEADDGASGWEHADSLRNYYSAKTIGFNEASIAKHNLNVYPNPTNGQVFIEAKELLGKCQVELWNSLGQRISATQMQGSNIPIFIEGKAGIYLLSITTADGQKQVYKVVKE